MWGGEYPWVRSLAHLFDVDREKNLSSLDSAAMLLVCAFLLAVITWVKRLGCDRYVFH